MLVWNNEQWQIIAGFATFAVGFFLVNAWAYFQPVLHEKNTLVIVNYTIMLMFVLALSIAATCLVPSRIKSD
jgi:hypothetical protein